MTPHPHLLAAALAAARGALSRLEASGDIDTDEAAALAILRDEAPDIEDVLTRVLRAMDEARASEEAISRRVDALQAREARFVRQAEEYRRTVFAILDALGLRKWRNAEFTVSVAPGRPGVVITDEAALPDHLVRVKREPDRTKIKEALENGEVVPGAMLNNTLPSLRITTR